MATINWSLQIKRDTAANWNSNDPTLLAGQLGYETDTGKLKIGSGASWSATSYFYGGAGTLAQTLALGNQTGGTKLIVDNGDAIVYNTGTANEIVYLNAGKEIASLPTATYPSLTELSYVKGVSSAIQTQINSKGDALTTNPLSQFAATTSAQLAGVISDETGSGALVFGTSPTFTTDITTPLINGVGGLLQIKTTDKLSVGNYATPANLRALTVGQDTAFMSFGSLVGTTSMAAIYLNVVTPSSSNYSITADSSDLYINTQSTTGSFYIRTANNNRFTFGRSGLSSSFAADSSGSTTSFNLIVPAHTGQTASTEIPNFKLLGNTKTWSAGAITTQRWNYFSANTAAFASASTITNSYGLYVEAATAGTNATITNNYAAGFDNNIHINNTAAGKGVYYGNGFVGVWSTSTNYFAFHHSNVTAATGYSLIQDNSGVSYLNGVGTINFRITNTTNMALTASLLTFSDAVNMAFNATTGTKIGTATTQKIGFWNATPIVQPTTAVAAATFVANTSGIVNDTATFDGYTIGQVVKALRNAGLLA